MKIACSPTRERGSTALPAAFAACLVLALLGCGTNPPAPGPDIQLPAITPPSANPMPPGETPAAAPKEGSGGSTFSWGDTKVKFKDDADKTLYSIKYKPDGAKLVDGSTPEVELARYTISDLKLKIKDQADVVLGYIIRSDDRYKIEAPDQTTELFKFIRQGDGDWKLEDGADKLIYKIKKRDYGFEIEDAAEGSLYKIKLKDNKTSIRDHQDKSVAATKDSISTLAATALALDAIADVRLRAALAVAIEGAK